MDRRPVKVADSTLVEGVLQITHLVAVLLVTTHLVVILQLENLLEEIIIRVVVALEVITLMETSILEVTVHTGHLRVDSISVEETIKTIIKIKATSTLTLDRIVDPTLVLLKDSLFRVPSAIHLITMNTSLPKKSRI